MISMVTFFCLLIVSYFSINDDNRMNFYAKLQINYVDMQKKILSGKHFENFQKFTINAT